MLYSYPVDATDDNWLHLSLVAAVRGIHRHIEAGTALPSWPKLFPKARRKRLSSFTSLGDRITGYETAVRGLTSAQRQILLDALRDQNEVAGLLAGTCDCCTIERLPEGARGAIQELFTFGFQMLTPTRVRDEHYKAIYAARPDHLCPFCGLEFFEAPGSPREPLDHYLAREQYPFAAANLRNLVPMGPRCNSSYKLGKDVRCPNGTKRRAFDPYANETGTLVLDQSVPFAGANGAYPRWEIHFTGPAEPIETWDEVFCVRQRFQSQLDDMFTKLLGEIARWARQGATAPQDRAAVIAALGSFESNLIELGLSDRAFLKAATVRMLRLRCEAGDQRLVTTLVAAMAPPTRLPPPIFGATIGGT